MELSLMALGFTLLVLVQCEKPGVVKVGCVFSFDSVIGRGAKVAMEMAVEDINSDPTILNGTQLEIIMEDLNCSVFMGSIKAFQVIEKEAVAIIGPQSSEIARIISHIASGLHIPVISFAATDPTLSSLQFPYFLRTAPTDSIQMAAIADIIAFCEWKEVLAVFMDDEYGRNGVTSLGQELANKMLKISHKLPLSPQYNQTEISNILIESKSLGPRVYVVHIYPDIKLNFFRTVQKLGMMSSNYVWIATDWLSSTLDSLDGDSYDDSLNNLQGVVTLRPHDIPNSTKKRAFMSRLKFSTAYGLYAYDTMWLVANSIDQYLKTHHGRITFSSRDKLQVGDLKVFNGGETLLKFMLGSSFTGLTGRVQFDRNHNLVAVDYEVLNVVGDKIHNVGYWSNDTGLSVQTPESLRRNKVKSFLENNQKLDNITWPGGEAKRPRGWVIATSEKPLRIGFPKRASFSEFVTEVSHSHIVRGYCIDLFVEVMKLVPYEVPFRLEPFGDGLKNPDYDQLVRMVADDVFDGAVGDIAISTNRIKMVDFTQPFTATGLVIVAPIDNSTSSGWVFIKPFTLELWCATSASFVIIAVVIWTLEHRVNDDFRGPPRRQLATMFLFSFSTLFKKNNENTVSTLGKIVMVMWLFLLLVITSSYTASLSSILTVQQLSTYITGIDSLISSGLPIGYQVGSFAYGYMRNSLSIHPSRLVSLGSPEEYESALRRGPTNGGVAAIVDELPYVDLFLSKQTDFGIVGQPFTKSGWGFAFQKDSPLAVDMSTAILKLSESGELQDIHKRWFCKPICPEETRTKTEANHLRLSSFWALYFVCGIFSLTAFSLFLIRAVRQYIKYRKKQSTEPSSSTFLMSSSVVFSSAIRNFLDFIDEKEEAIKRIFAQHNQPPTQVSQ